MMMPGSLALQQQLVAVAPAAAIAGARQDGGKGSPGQRGGVVDEDEGPARRASFSMAATTQWRGCAGAARNRRRRRRRRARRWEPAQEGARRGEEDGEEGKGEGPAWVPPQRLEIRHRRQHLDRRREGGAGKVGGRERVCFLAQEHPARRKQPLQLDPAHLAAFFLDGARYCSRGGGGHRLKQQPLLFAQAERRCGRQPPEPQHPPWLPPPPRATVVPATAADRLCLRLSLLSWVLAARVLVLPQPGGPRSTKPR